MTAEDRHISIRETTVHISHRLQSFSQNHQTYTDYSIGSAIVWTLIWMILKTTATKQTQNRIALVSGGWWMGWLSATIARAGYPPPKKQLFHHQPLPPGA
jgi:hypothetical protein